MKLLSRNREKHENAEDGVTSKKKNRFFKKGKEGLEDTEKPLRKKWPKKKIVIAGVILLAVVVVGLRSCGKPPAQVQTEYENAAVEKRDITEVLTSSGTLEPADSYNVTTLIAGDILSADFEEGDVVSKGDVLYKMDSSNAATGIERASLSVEQSRRSYSSKADSISDLTIAAPFSGTVTGITLKKGDAVGMQTAVATIQDTATLTLTQYYSDAYAGQIYVGMPATVSVADQMLNLNGSVKEVSARKRISSTGVSCFAVTVQVSNPGALTPGAEATCWLAIGGQQVYPSIVDDDGLDAAEGTTIYAKVSGTVADIRIKNGETVSAGQTIIRLSSDTLDDELKGAADAVKDAELALKSQHDSLDDYTITAPIDGTIIDKYYKQGETSESGKPLCIIYDLSSLTMTLNVDELDISNIAVGQNAEITAEAAGNKTYEGVITKIGINGTTTNGVTTYPVSIRIDQTEGLLPGMNVDVSIMVQESLDTLAVPADAVDHSGKVLVKTKDGSTDKDAPEGFRFVEVETGIADDDVVEILSGLQEGDTIAYIPHTVVGSDVMQQMMTEESGPPSGGPQGGGNGPSGAPGGAGAAGGGAQ